MKTEQIEIRWSHLKEVGNRLTSVMVFVHGRLLIYIWSTSIYVGLRSHSDRSTNEAYRSHLLTHAFRI